MLITIIIALLFPNARLVLCQIIFYDFPKVRNLPNIFLRSFENVAPVFYLVYFIDRDDEVGVLQSNRL